MAKNLNYILGVELLCAAQGVEFRAPLKTSPALQAAIARLRQDVPSLEDDRYLAPDLEAAQVIATSGALAQSAGVNTMVVT